MDQKKQTDDKTPPLSAVWNQVTVALAKIRTHTHAALYMPASATYSTISGNDGDTDVTGAELETLTGGGTTTLHKHKSIQLTYTHGGNAAIPTGATRYLGWEDVVSGLQTSIYNITVPVACEIRNLYVTTNSAQPATGNMVFTVMQNTSTATALAVTVAANAAANTYSNTVNTVSLSAGDSVSLRIVNNAGSNSALIIRCVMEIDIPTL